MQQIMPSCTYAFIHWHLQYNSLYKIILSSKTSFSLNCLKNGVTLRANLSFVRT